MGRLLTFAGICWQAALNEALNEALIGGSLAEPGTGPGIHVPLAHGSLLLGAAPLALCFVGFGVHYKRASWESSTTSTASADSSIEASAANATS